ncbi:sensor histidine kinase [Fulvivirga sediminis]|uniref:Histidine kinase n=1 Tax=Fulvivirga sediminis TaxID=2803949 RepID=A0A937F9N7_9BACT|nr:histidine kinase [Fulvivirga sediminis]MBL3657562.1 histidine kinase [Fulvivirga sediminis]
MASFFTAQRFKKELKEILILTLLGIANGFLLCNDCMTSPDKLMASVAICMLFWVLMYKGNIYISHLIDKKISWLDQPVKRLIIGVAGHAAFTSLAALLIIDLTGKIFNLQWRNISTTVMYSTGIAILVSLVLHSYKFLISWRQVAIEAERVKKEAAVSKYESLKNQVNPHFLFNSLNALTTLVYEDQDVAAKFIKKLSEVYRYVLESKDMELVPLATEIKFVEAYIFLQKIRYENDLDFEVLINGTQHMIIPLSVQMLVENAIKHNTISAEEPLHISIRENDGFLEVVNNLQRKNIIKEESSHTGLDNIKARFAFVSDAEVQITDHNHEFKVRLPLIKLKK